MRAKAAWPEGAWPGLQRWSGDGMPRARWGLPGAVALPLGSRPGVSGRRVATWPALRPEHAAVSAERGPVRAAGNPPRPARPWSGLQRRRRAGGPGLRFSAGNRAGPRGPGRPAPRADAAGSAVHAWSCERRSGTPHPTPTRVDAQAEGPRAPRGAFPSRGQWSQSRPRRGGRLQAVSRGPWRRVGGSAAGLGGPGGKAQPTHSCLLWGSWDGWCLLCLPESPSPARPGRDGGPSPHHHGATSHHPPPPNPSKLRMGERNLTLGW